jgi:hypothetical protein
VEVVIPANDFYTVEFTANSCGNANVVANAFSMTKGTTYNMTVNGSGFSIN